MSGFRPLAIGTTLCALAALALPSVTHFADGGLSLALVFVWAVLLVYALVRHRPRAWWLLLTAPIALFWPAVIAATIASGNLRLSF